MNAHMDERLRSVLSNTPKEKPSPALLATTSAAMAQAPQKNTLAWLYWLSGAVVLLEVAVLIMWPLLPLPSLVTGQLARVCAIFIGLVSWCWVFMLGVLLPLAAWHHRYAAKSHMEQLQPKG